MCGAAVRIITTKKLAEGNMRIALLCSGKGAMKVLHFP
jgi:hypothetical protein